MIELIQAEGSLERDLFWPLTALDKANLMMAYRGTWVFDRDLDEDGLKASLRQLLNSYPTLAGRIRRANHIHLNNKGVPFSTNSKPEIRIADLRADHRLAGSLTHRPNLGKIVLGLEPVMTVCLTRIADGCVLSFFCAHALMDGNSFFKMVVNLAHLYAGREISSLCFDPSLVPGAFPGGTWAATKRALAAGWWIPWPVWLLAMIPQLVSGALLERSKPFHFSSSSLEALRQRAIRESGCETITINDALCAHLSLACGRLNGHAADKILGQVFVVDARKHLATIPEEYVGNASYVVRGAKFSVDDSLGALAERIHHRLAPYLASPSQPLLEEVQLGMSFLKKLIPLLPYDLRIVYKRRPTCFYINSFRKVPVYEVDFGPTGDPLRPVLVVPHDMPDPVVVWPAHPSRGGVEVYLRGVLARAAERLELSDPWWREMQLP